MSLTAFALLGILVGFACLIVGFIDRVEPRKETGLDREDRALRNKRLHRAPAARMRVHRRKAA